MEILCPSGAPSSQSGGAGLFIRGSIWVPLLEFNFCCSASSGPYLQLQNLTFTNFVCPPPSVRNAA